MVLHTQLLEPAIVITKNAEPWSVNGNQGITYRLTLMIGEEVEKIKVLDDVVFNQIEKGKTYIFEGVVNVRNAKVGELKISGFMEQD